MLVTERWVRVVRWACVLVMHLKDWPAQLLKLFAGNSAALALVAINVESLLALSPPRCTGVVGAVCHKWHLLGERQAKRTAILPLRQA